MHDHNTKPVEPEELQGTPGGAAPATLSGQVRCEGPAIDLSVISSLRELQDPGEPDFITELIDVLCADAPVKLEALRASVTAGDAHRVNRIAHSMKSSCGNLGALPLARVFAAIEKRGADNDLAAVNGLLEEAGAEFERAKAALATQRRDASHQAA